MPGRRLQPDLVDSGTAEQTATRNQCLPLRIMDEPGNRLREVPHDHQRTGTRAFDPRYRNTAARFQGRRFTSLRNTACVLARNQAVADAAENRGLKLASELSREP